MNIVIAHYHLQRGGVCRVVANHLAALAQVLENKCTVLLLHDGQRDGIADAELEGLGNIQVREKAIPQLSYDPDGIIAPQQVTDAFEQAMLAEGFSQDDTVLHIHNHSLGKNAAYTGACSLLAEKGWRLLLQIHDFAEDLRPKTFAYLNEHLGEQQDWYPQASHIHYAALNQRDFRILQKCIARPQVSVLPNPVKLHAQEGDAKTGRASLQAAGHDIRDRYVLYPVRGISRKNVGECVLYAACSGDNSTFSISLDPENPGESDLYHFWRSLSAALNLPMIFGSGHTNNLKFADHCAAADYMLSTSVAEGFGMTFCESYLLGKPLIGRDLPDITADFKYQNIRFPGLKTALPIPMSWFQRDQWLQRTAKAYGKMCADYHLPIPSERLLQERLCKQGNNDSIDFASLDTTAQTQVIKAVCSDSGKRRELSAFTNELFGRDQTQVINDNADIIRDKFGLKASGELLLEHYQRVLNSSVSKVSPNYKAQQLLQAFCDPARFRPVRLGKSL